MMRAITKIGQVVLDLPPWAHITLISLIVLWGILAADAAPLLFAVMLASALVAKKQEK